MFLISVFCVCRGGRSTSPSTSRCWPPPCGWPWGPHTACGPRAGTWRCRCASQVIARCDVIACGLLSSLELTVLVSHPLSVGCLVWCPSHHVFGSRHGRRGGVARARVRGSRGLPGLPVGHVPSPLHRHVHPRGRAAVRLLLGAVFHGHRGTGGTTEVRVTRRSICSTPLCPLSVASRNVIVAPFPRIAGNSSSCRGP